MPYFKHTSSAVYWYNIFQSATICLERVTSETYHKLALMHKLTKLTYYDETKNMAYGSQIVQAGKTSS